MAGGAAGETPAPPPESQTLSPTLPPTASSTVSAPARVVSINLCTDQLAMMLAAPGQLASVSYLASDPRSSTMVDEAAAYPANHARAEEVYLMRPDLVLAGQYTSAATVSMLRRMGIRVEQFAPARSLDDVVARMQQMGAALGRQATTQAAVTRFRTALDEVREDIARHPRAALYYANGYTTGDNTLAGQIVIAAGFENAATEAGYPGGGFMPLEVLAMIAPDAVITSKPYRGASRSEAILDHPVVARLRARVPVAGFSDRDWICGTPHVLRAIDDTVRLRRALPDAATKGRTE